jgi:hypothetical protein
MSRVRPVDSIPGHHRRRVVAPQWARVPYLVRAARCSGLTPVVDTAATRTTLTVAAVLAALLAATLHALTGEVTADIQATIMADMDPLAARTRTARMEEGTADTLLPIVRAAEADFTAAPVEVPMVAEDHMEEEAVVPTEEVGTAKRD